MATVWFEGVDELNRVGVDLGKASFQVIRQGGQLVRKTGADMERDGKMFCPVDTGHLQGTISHAMTGPLSAEAGPTAEYGPYVEYGTSRMAPQAFMGPALDRNTPAFVSAAEQLAVGALEQAL